MATMKEHDIVISTVSKPDDGIYIGSVGTIVFVHSSADRHKTLAFEVEFPPESLVDRRYPLIELMKESELKLKPIKQMTKKKTAPTVSKWKVEDNIPVTSGPATEHYLALDALTVQPGQKLGQCITFPTKDTKAFISAKSSVMRANTNKRFIYRKLSSVQGRIWRVQDGMQLKAKQAKRKK